MLKYLVNILLLHLIKIEFFFLKMSQIIYNGTIKLIDVRGIKFLEIGEYDIMCSYYNNNNDFGIYVFQKSLSTILQVAEDELIIGDLCIYNAEIISIDFNNKIVICTKSDSQNIKLIPGVVISEDHFTFTFE